MPSPEILEFEALLAPIPGDNPAGADLRADSSPTSLYYAVKDARSTARAQERQELVEGDESAAPPDWRLVLQKGTKALTEKAKDLEVAAYLTEALVRLHGFAGLRDGFRLARGLVEQFWDGLYPQPDEEGMLTRVAPLTGLNGDDAEGTLINPIQKVPLTEGRSVGPFSYVDYQQSLALGRIQDETVRQQRAQRGGGVLPEVFERAVAETSAPFFRNLVEDVTAAQEEFAKLSAVLEEKCGALAPPTSNIRGALTTCLDTVMALARDKLATLVPQEEAPPEGEAAAAAEGNGEAVAGPRVAGAIRDRNDALNTLLKVADYFRRTEPHTPVSYLLEQAVRWGRMTLPELLTELIPEEAPRTNFFKQVGIKPPPPEQPAG